MASVASSGGFIGKASGGRKAPSESKLHEMMPPADHVPGATQPVGRNFSRSAINKTHAEARKKTLKAARR